jgi:hypothetical protein
MCKSYESWLLLLLLSYWFCARRIVRNPGLHDDRAKNARRRKTTVISFRKYFHLHFINPFLPAAGRTVHSSGAHCSPSSYTFRASIQLTRRQNVIIGLPPAYYRIRVCERVRDDEDISSKNTVIKSNSAGCTSISSSPATDGAPMNF